jgi:hypothetical protein
VPPVIDNTGGCTWTLIDIDRWNGPYTASTFDPWGRPYMYDPDYYPYRYCPSRPEEDIMQAILSRGEDGAVYTCDDIFLELR